MRLLYPAAGAIALFLTTPGFGLAADRTYNDLPAFTAIHVDSGIDAVVTVGPAQSIAATAPEAADLDDVKVEVRHGMLKIWRDWDIFELFDDMGGRQIRFTIAAPKLDSANASSGADVEVSGLAGENVWLESSSGADLDATDIQATNIEVGVSSGADITANGTCTKLKVEVSSGANANLEHLVCSEGEAKSSSGSDATIHVGSTLRAKASSGSDITVKGKPATTEIDESSGGTITIED